MLKTITAGAAAAAIAITSFAATPAQALDRGETMRLLLGLAAAGVVMHEASKHDKVMDRRHRQSSRNDPPTVRVAPGYRGKRHKNSRYLPARCETDVPTRRGERTFFGKPCLERSGFRAALPRQCARTLDFGRREVLAYGKGCLRRHGYRMRG